MPKKFLEDMVKSKREKEQGKTGLKNFNPVEVEVIEKRVEYVEFGKRYSNQNKSRYFLWFIAMFSVLFCFFAASLMFAKAKIVVNPKNQDIVLNENLIADRDSSTSGLSYDLVVIPGNTSKNITVNGEKSVSIKATGTAVIFNQYSSASQAFNVNTRLQGSNGKIYMTQTKIVVPGMNKDGTPGQVEVGIIASSPGVEYNSDPLDFTIIGFKGTVKYSKFIVRSKAETTIAGGFVGNAPDISPSDLSIAEGELKTTLGGELFMKATAQIPEGYILFKDATFLDTNDTNISSVYNGDGSATITLNGTFYGIILSEQQLTTKIAGDSIAKYDGSDVYISNINNLVFSSTIPKDNTITSLQNINFNLSGSAKFVWRLNVDKFTSDLLGRSKSDFTQILSQYSNIDSATLTITPIWKMSIPNQIKDVKVIVNYPN